MRQQHLLFFLREHQAQAGSAVPAFVFGMVFGLLIALGVALFVSKSSMSFSAVGGSQSGSAKSSSSPTSAVVDTGGSLPDPNTALHGRNTTKPAAEVQAAQQASAGAGQKEGVAPASEGKLQPVQPSVQVQYFLQLGSFRNPSDAEQLRAKLALLGTESQVAIGEVNGSQVNRVRVGPFPTANAAYQARAPLTKDGFEASVVKE